MNEKLLLFLIFFLPAIPSIIYSIYLIFFETWSLFNKIFFGAVFFGISWGLLFLVETLCVLDVIQDWLLNKEVKT